MFSQVWLVSASDLRKYEAIPGLQVRNYEVIRWELCSFLDDSIHAPSRCFVWTVAHINVQGNSKSSPMSHVCACVCMCVCVWSFV